MNKTKIEWTDYTWNPVGGCWGPGGTARTPKRCPYCYAEQVSKRFGVPTPDDCSQPGQGFHEARYKRGNPFRYGFEPTFYSYRLGEPGRVKKPGKIFVCSMGDLFGDWVPDGWIEQVKVEAIHNPRHTFQFLTKNPKRLSEFNPWPSNCWVGTTVTNQADADERLPWLLKAEAPVRFVSHEPLMGQINLQSVVGPEGLQLGTVLYSMEEAKGIDWAIIGAMTGPGAVRPEVDWVVHLEYQYQLAGVPVFEKDNLLPLCGPGAELQRKWPA